MDCTELETVAAELALGIADGAERAAALSHLARCPACRALLDDLVSVADGLLLLGPAVEPPLGFETRVRDRLSGAGLPVRRRWRRRAGLTAAAILIAVSVGGLIGRETSGAARQVMTTAEARWLDGTCRMVAFSGHPTELVVRLDEPGEGTSDYNVLVEPAHGGPAVPLGAIHIQDGRGVLDAVVPAAAGRVSAIRVVTPTGTMHYRATFAAV
jgi:hypothetical protein